MKTKAKKIALVCLFAISAIIAGMNLISTPEPQSPAPSHQIAILP
ncbi:MAG: hypothetical protein AB8F95_19920 [Bacteroidia bacterium]